MGITIAGKTEYANTVSDLFPRGEYWDRQFENSESDLNLFCEAKTQEIIMLRKRMADLLAESGYEYAEETLEDWERVLLGYTNPQLSLEERRAVLRDSQTQVINRTIMADIAQKYGLLLIDIVFPFKTSFFGFSTFGTSLFSRPAFYSMFYIISVFQDEELRSEAKRRIKDMFINSSFGAGCFGTARFLNRSLFIKDFSSSIFLGMNSLEEFEKELNSKLPASNIAYYQYKL
jgi:hypothetical protein